METAYTSPAEIPADRIPTPCGGFILGLEYNEVCSKCGNRCYDDVRGRVEARQAKFQELRKLASQSGATMLPTEIIGDKLYYVDGRLREYRNVDDPNDRIQFDERCFAEFVMENEMEDEGLSGLI
jgi:hypothetical protein